MCATEAGGSQSPHSSIEAGNDRGAKGGRKVKDEGNRDAPRGFPPVAVGLVTGSGRDDREVVVAMRFRDSVVMLAASKGEQGMAQAFLGEAMGNLVSLAQG